MKRDRPVENAPRKALSVVVIRKATPGPISTNLAGANQPRLRREGDRRSYLNMVEQSSAA